MDCIFCKIINGDIPSYKLYEDDTVLAFLDLNQDAIGHTLVIPKKHYLNMYDIDKETLAHIFEVAKDISKRIESVFNTQGVAFTQNNGDLQEVKHFHLHIYPYYSVKKQKLDIEEIYNKLKA